jgi:hypothetical protein
MRANKLKDRLPQLLDETESALVEWKDMEDSPFLYDGRDYLVRPDCELHLDTPSST